MGPVQERRKHETLQVENLLIEEIRTNKELILDMKNQINKLEEKNEILKEMIENQNREQQIIIQTIGVAQSFIESYLQNDTKKMESSIVDTIIINKTSIRYEYSGENVELPIKTGDLHFRLNSFGIEDQTVFYQYMIYEEPSIGIQNGFFMNLSLKLIEGTWQIVSISYDI